MSNISSLLRQHTFISLAQGTIGFATVIGLLNVYNKCKNKKDPELIELENSYAKCKKIPNADCEKIKSQINEHIMRKILESSSS